MLLRELFEQVPGMITPASVKTLLTSIFSGATVDNISIQGQEITARVIHNGVPYTIGMKAAMKSPGTPPSVSNISAISNDTLKDLFSDPKAKSTFKVDTAKVSGKSEIISGLTKNGYVHLRVTPKAPMSMPKAQLVPKDQKPNISTTKPQYQSDLVSKVGSGLGKVKSSLSKAKGQFDRYKNFDPDSAVDSELGRVK